MEKYRLHYFDLLRILGSFAVVIIHVSGQFSGMINVYTENWMAMNIYGGLVRWSVPIFIMVSGACFLGGGYSLRRLISKNIFRVAVSFAIWSSVYACIEVARGRITGIESFAAQIIFGHYHMWFLYMLIGLYLIIPILDCIVEKKEATYVFLCLGFVFNFILPWVYTAIGKFSGSLVGAVCSAVANMNMRLVMGYSFYFVLGYVLRHKDFSWIIRIVIYVFGGAAGIATIWLTKYVSYKTGNLNEEYFDFLSLNVCLQSIAVFLLAKYTLLINKKSRVIRVLSTCSFGIYLIHPMILEFLNESLKINSLSINPIVGIPVLAGTIYMLSFVLSWVLIKIPVVGKYLA